MKHRVRLYSTNNILWFTVFWTAAHSQLGVHSKTHELASAVYMLWQNSAPRGQVVIRIRIHPEMNISWKRTHPRVIKCVDELASSSDLENCITCSAVNGCRQNESLITIIHITPVHQLTSWEDKSCVCNLIPKYESIIHNNSSSKCICRRLSHQSRFGPFLVWFICADFSPDSDSMTWKKQCYGQRSQWFGVKNILMLDLFHLSSSPDVNWWTGVVWWFYQTLVLTAPIHFHWWDSGAETHFYKPDEETHSSGSWMIFSFEVNSSFHVLFSNP